MDITSKITKDFIAINYNDIEIKAIAQHITDLEFRGYYTCGRKCPICKECATMIRNKHLIQIFCLNCNKIVIEEGYDF